jgi:hypothetical protein
MATHLSHYDTDLRSRQTGLVMAVIVAINPLALITVSSLVLVSQV